MTERMQDYRDRMDEKGLVQVRIWVEEQDEDFIKYIANALWGRVRKSECQTTMGYDVT
jgi:hypothetical protein